MATPRFNTKSPTIKRILREAAELSNSPSPEYTAAPLESDLFEWHFTLRGPPRSAFAEGIYHGRIVLPPTYPLAPPSFRFATPSGRFEPNREICLSISGHHADTWQPAWGVRTAIVALRTFMETGASGQIGGLDTSDAVRTRLAAASKAWRCPVCARANEDIMAECEARHREFEEANGGPEAGGAGAGASQRTEVEVPAELKMGFRDEMEKANNRPADGQGGDDKEEEEEDDDDEAAELAEGFVQTVPDRLVSGGERAPPPPLAPPAASSTAPTYPLPRPAQGVPAPTGRVPLPDPIAPLAPAPRQRPLPVAAADSNSGVPAWVDYAISSLVILLVAMLLKIVMGY
ncbi:UBC-like protein [Xylariaceae sp. FL0804]|nr:UBC-like protein [Xylariaceae sp. FL0804]